jgi:hypothetical protein
MGETGTKLYELLPEFVRFSDHREGGSLRVLMSALQWQYDLIEGDIDSLYDDQFIETCAAAVVPLIGDLVGVLGLSRPEGQIPTQRARVANTLAYRRRKGLAAVVARAAANASGWPCHVVEALDLLAGTQALESPRPDWGRTVDVRNLADGRGLAAPFDSNARTVDVTRPNRPGDPAPPWVARHPRFNLPNLIVFAWRLQSYPVFRANPRRLGDARYSFDPFGLDVPLFNQPRTADGVVYDAAPANLPIRLSRRRLSREPSRSPPATPALHYREARIPGRRVLICDLSEWQADWPLAASAAGPQTLWAAIDPELGRFMLSRDAAEEDLQVDYSYARAGDVGGGPYPRSDDGTAEGPERDWKALLVRGAKITVEPSDDQVRLAVQQVASSVWQAALDAERAASEAMALARTDPLHSDARAELANIAATREAADQALSAAGAALLAARDAKLSLAEDETAAEIGARLYNSPVAALQAWSESGRDGLIELADSSTYPLDLTLELLRAPEPQPTEPRRLVLRAREGCAPCLRGDLRVIGNDLPFDLVLEGLWIDGTIILEGSLALKLRHCTVMPQSSHTADTLRRLSLDVVGEDHQDLQVEISHCIVGGLSLPADMAELAVADTIMDAGDGFAVGASADPGHQPRLGPAARIRRSTIFGRLLVDSLDALDSLFLDRIEVANRQRGGVRNSFVPPGSRTPACQRCQPELALSAAGGAGARRNALLRTAPVFTSTRFGQPGFAQLSADCPAAILTGAGNGAEMGAFNGLQRAQREANLMPVFHEYLPWGWQAQVSFVT